MKTTNYSRKVLLVVSWITSLSFTVNGQCDPTTPTFNVDLTASPFMSWTSPLIDRLDNCCGTTAPDKCIEFVITLHPDAASVVFTIASGAIPPGALFYQIDCGPITPVGTPICLTGVGPFHLTFCKPGNNKNTFTIQTIPNPVFGPDLTLSDGCSGELSVYFYDESSITWNSIQPGAPGAYNGLLSCTSGCDTTTVSGSPIAPALVGYQVCGLAANGCIVGPVCDTLFVTNVSPIQLSISSPDTVLCFNEPTTTLTADIVGGAAPYTFNWSSGQTTQIITVGPGTYTVTVNDSLNCQLYQDQITVVQLPAPIVNAGLDIDVCSNAVVSVALGGSSANTSAVIWNGGLGAFAPDNTTAATTYFPTAAEIASGSLTLILQSDDVSGCPDVTDDMTIFFHPVAQSVVVTPTDISCFGLTDGSVSVAVVGAEGPYTYSYDGGAYSASTTQNNLGAGNHTVNVMSAMGCDTLISFTIVEPALLTVVESAHTDVACFGENNGSSTGFVSGGTLAYTYSWNTLPVQTTATASALISGNYILSVTDANGCATSMNVTITEPPLPSVNAGLDIDVCSNAVVSVALGGSSANTSAVVWNGGLGAFAPDNTTAATTYFPTAAEIASGSLTLTLQSDDVSGCPDVTDDMTIFFHPVAQSVVVTPTDISCFGLTDGSVSVAVVGAEGPYTYSYDGGAYSASTTQNNLGAGNHTVNVMSAMGCDTLIAFTIVEPALLTVVESAHTDVACFGENNGSSTGFVSGGTLAYTYSWNTLPVQTTATASALISGNYVLSVTDANGCATSMNVTITEPPLLQLSFNIVPPSCNGFANGNVSSNVVGGVAPYNYLWSTTETGTAIHDITAGQYSLSITDSKGCTVSSTAVVTEPNPLIVTVSADTTICPGTAIPLNAFAQGGSGTYQYNWVPGGNGNSIVVNPMSNQTYSCTVTDNNGCVISANVQVNTFSLNPADLSIAAGATTLCLQDSTQLVATYTGNDPTVVLVWSHCPCAASTIVTPFVTTIYTVTATNQCGQQLIANQLITVTNPPMVSLNPSMGEICVNESVSFSSQGDNDPDWGYEWTFGDGNSSENPLPTHIYGEEGHYTVSLTVHTLGGCLLDSVMFSSVIVHPRALAIFSSSSLSETTMDPTFHFTNNSQNAGIYSWDFGDGSNSIITSPSHTYETFGFYTIVLNANNEFNCPGSTELTVEVTSSYDLYVPNAFTPDGDKSNNIFQVQGYGIAEDGFGLQIFDRWGELIYSSGDMSEGWDGSNKKGEDIAQDGVYTWVVQFKDLRNGTHVANGHVSLLK
ncbi:MAG: hypothetical protein CHH17_04870 [Candidatus Fluviicola riflensis]|nr:MAG: hypothetical protein CHH17_04870 [Candidatus Fluviicola riflensis]